jgi:4-hydroxy-tetrahydrodipicolinate synthase
MKSLRRLIDHFLECGVHGIVCCGSTGEAGTLSKEERQHVEVTVDQVSGRGLVVAGTGTGSTRSTIELTREAKAAGADAALGMTPDTN